jgi:hypothetical protein
MAAFFFLVTCVEFVEPSDFFVARVVSRMHTP